LLTRALLAGVLAVTLLGSGAGAAAAGPASAPGPEEPPGPSELVDSGIQPLAAPPSLAAANFRLKATAYSSLISRFDATLPKVAVRTVFGDGDQAARSCTASAANLSASFCWTSTDTSTSLWYPQGITTTADADASGSYDQSTGIVVSWHDDSGAYAGTHGIRLSFVNYSNPSAPTYREVLLVTPGTTSDGKLTYDQVDLHAGGIAWYGDYIYLASTNGGLRVFDVRHIYQVSTTQDKMGLQSDGSYQAYKHKYVLPQAFQYDRSSINGYSELTYSFVSLDRTSSPDSLVVGEYAYPGTGTRLVRFPADESSHLLAASSDGYVHGTEAYTVSVTSMQGAASINGKFYLSTSDGDSNKGDLQTFVPGSSVVQQTDALPIGAEDFSYWPGKQQLWGVAEHPGSRVVYAIKVQPGTPPGPCGTVSLDRSSYPALQQGSTDKTAVCALQTLLKSAGQSVTVDGTYGDSTRTAVASYQTSAGVYGGSTGNADKWTWTALLARGSSYPQISSGSSGEAVVRLQRALTAALGQYVAQDGAFGPGTTSAAKSYQSLYSPPADGVVGSGTWGHLKKGR
jgi:hypothetical protein